MSTPDQFKNIRILNINDTTKAAKCLLAAFGTDDLATLLVNHIDDPKHKVLCELSLYEAYVRQHIMAGLVLGINETEEEFETVGVWSLPDSIEKGLESFSTLMKSGYGKVWEIYGEEGRFKVFDGMLPLLHDTCERILTTDSRFHKKKLFTLVYLGSTEAARGKGNVRKMFDFMFQNYIDVCPDNLSYLESSALSNIPIYERFGFHFYEDIMLGEKKAGSEPGNDYAVMNVMIRGTNGHDWTKDAPVSSPKL
ncbi:hypothetical protein CANTEDRAFT_99133 [Yamadazyma tenuis ATCC 10573]|uniref:N-acetyltransferase domain-containing protein n=2 Tax=Candida tenuis TaxID=2315449 RepID=G3BAE6_CANTC|nr:uncharacterized protein CANTEDRAFT_99133 [Yamadazyma tenuis ATCC 10573]EGV62042.1 hypothetical protein CANTEDRAFT_99133 [Yamadazyma tenuis ATCC 10573]